MKVTGLHEFQRKIEELQRVMQALDGQIGAVKFNPSDPESIERAIQKINDEIDALAGSTNNNSALDSIVLQMKEICRDGIIRRAAAARLKDENE